MSLHPSKMRITIVSISSFSSDVLLRMAINGTKLPVLPEISPGVYDYADISHDSWVESCHVVRHRLLEMRHSAHLEEHTFRGARLRHLGVHTDFG